MWQPTHMRHPTHMWQPYVHEADVNEAVVCVCVRETEGMCASERMYVHVLVRMWVHVYVHVHVCMCVSLCAHVYVCMWMCMCVDALVWHMYGVARVCEFLALIHVSAFQQPTPHLSWCIFVPTHVCVRSLWRFLTLIFLAHLRQRTSWPHGISTCCVCMYITNMFTNVYVCVYLCKHVYIYICARTPMYVYVHVYALQKNCETTSSVLTWLLP